MFWCEDHIHFFTFIDLYINKTKRRLVYKLRNNWTKPWKVAKRVTSQFVNFPTGVIQVASQPKVTHSALIPRGGLIMTQMRFFRRAKNKSLLNRCIFHAFGFLKGRDVCECLVCGVFCLFVCLNSLLILSFITRVIFLTRNILSWNETSEFSTSYFKGAYNLFYSDVLFFEREFVWIKRIFHFGGE